MLTSLSQTRLSQTTHRDHFGLPLEVDGKLGTHTLWALKAAALPPARRRIIERCQLAMSRQVVEAKGDNRHPFIDVLNDEVLVPLGSAWCAAFACWALSYIRKTGSAQTLGRSFVATQDPAPGDLMWYPTGSWQGHCGIVAGVSIDQVMCYEGNQQNALRVTRRPRLGLFFGRTCNADVQHMPGIPTGLRLLKTAGQRRGTR